nr:MAG TPA: hypothetical protein [Bacteriophage sp.]
MEFRCHYLTIDYHKTIVIVPKYAFRIPSF